MNTGCEFYEDALTEHAAGRLAGERARTVVEHLGVCADCRSLLETILAVRGAAVAVPDGLEARIRSAVREAAGVAGRIHEASAARPARHAGSPRAFSRTRWALPLTAAAALALVWVGVGEYRDGNSAGSGGAAEPVSAVEEYVPYGAWPASDVVAGDPLLSELSTEELERLLEEMES